MEYFRPGVSVLERHNVGLVCRLAISGSSAKLTVATTQLLANQKRTDVKLSQACLLLAEIDRLTGRDGGNSHHPIIVAGNFNSFPFSHVYQLLTTGVMKYEGLTFGKGTLGRYCSTL